MPRHLLVGTSAVALATLAALSPARAQVAAPELVIEGPITDITIDDVNGDTITVMGIVIKVPRTAEVATPTRSKLKLSDLKNTVMPGRPQGFKDGTAIVTGGSDAKNGNGVTATEVFTDMNENVVVGEVTSEPGPGSTLAVNGLPMYPIPEGNPVMPAAKPMNVFGFEIDPTTVEKGSLISIEGYLSHDEPRRLYYHTLEADTGTPKLVGANEVSITRAQCRDRTDNNRDELDVRGAVHLAKLARLTTANRGTVTLSFPAINPRTRARFTDTATATPVLDPLTPGYAVYRLSVSNRNLAGCPLTIKASWKGDTDTELATTDADAEAR
jgi:hypothetical protein